MNAILSESIKKANTEELIQVYLTIAPKVEPLLKKSNEELSQFNTLSESSLDFWNNTEDDVYDTFYTAS